jgi:hypothetical protein
MPGQIKSRKCYFQVCIFCYHFSCVFYYRKKGNTFDCWMLSDGFSHFHKENIQSIKYISGCRKTRSLPIWNRPQQSWGTHCVVAPPVTSPCTKLERFVLSHSEHLYLSCEDQPVTEDQTLYLFFPPLPNTVVHLSGEEVVQYDEQHFLASLQRSDHTQ